MALPQPHSAAGTTGLQKATSARSAISGVVGPAIFGFAIKAVLSATSATPGFAIKAVSSATSAMLAITGFTIKSVPAASASSSSVGDAGLATKAVLVTSLFFSDVLVFKRRQGLAAKTGEVLPFKRRQGKRAAKARALRRLATFRFPPESAWRASQPQRYQVSDCPYPPTAFVFVFLRCDQDFHFQFRFGSVEKKPNIDLKI